MSNKKGYHPGGSVPRRNPNRYSTRPLMQGEVNQRRSASRKPKPTQKSSVSNSSILQRDQFQKTAQKPQISQAKQFSQPFRMQRQPQLNILGRQYSKGGLLKSSSKLNTGIKLRK
jgi:hypothetical protein